MESAAASRPLGEAVGDQSSAIARIRVTEADVVDAAEVSGVPMQAIPLRIIRGGSFSPGQAFEAEEGVRALTLVDGSRVEALPHQYFDSSAKGRIIHLWQLTPVGTGSVRQLCRKWNSKDEVMAALTEWELRRHQLAELEGLEVRPAARYYTSAVTPSQAATSDAQPTSHGQRTPFPWHALIFAVLVIGVTLVGWQAIQGSPTASPYLLPSIIGGAGLLIFAFAASAIVQMGQSR